VLMWSDKQIFSYPKSQFVDTISTKDIDFALASLLKTRTNENSKLSTSFNENMGAPEVVVLFIEPELATDQVPQIASAFASTLGGSFSHLKDTLEAASSSLVMPYVNVDEVTLFDETLSNAFDTLKEGSIFVTRTTGSDLFVRLGRQAGVKSVEIDSLMTELKSANAFTNGVTDLVIVCFDKPVNGKVATFASHDEIIGSVSQNIRTATKGNYVAMYSANRPSASRLTWSFNQPTEADDFIRFVMMDDDNITNKTNSTNSTTVNYFPGALIEVYLIAAILIAMLFTGGCAIFSLQTPDRWEAPKVKREVF